jgi:hypothetical protein
MLAFHLPTTVDKEPIFGNVAPTRYHFRYHFKKKAIPTAREWLKINVFNGFITLII